MESRNMRDVSNDATGNAQYLTLSALLSGGITTTVKDKNNSNTPVSIYFIDFFLILLLE